MNAFTEFLRSQPSMALFLCFALGYWIGNWKIGSISLGGVCGTLLVALVLGQTGVRLAPDLKTVAFELFIFALGFAGGPQFFANLYSGWRYGILSLIEMITVLFLVLGFMIVFHLDSGTTAGIVAGAATESAVIGTASDALGKLNLPIDQIHALQNNVVTTYSVTYLMGLICIVLFTSQLAPAFMKINLKEEAAKLFTKMGGSSLADGQTLGIPLLVGRTYRVKKVAGKTVRDIEADYGHGITVQNLKRGDATFEPSVDEKLIAGDEILIVGRREQMIQAAEAIGPEISPSEQINIGESSEDVLVTTRDAHNVAIKDLRRKADPDISRGVYISAVQRMENVVPALPETVIQRGDVVTLFGLRSTIAKAGHKLGYTITPTIKTDFVFLGIGIFIGILLGHISFRIAGVPISFGTGGGCLISGLFFGWARAKFPVVGSLPSAATQILRDFGLATFIATVGLSSGPDAIRLIRTYGLLLPLIGIAVSLVPALISLYVGRRWLKLEPPILLGAIAGQQVSTPAISSLVAAAGNSTPVIGYTITYAISNVLLPLLGPIVVGIATLITRNGMR